MLRIVAVSYINTWPFIYGINHSGILKDYILTLDVPSGCARLFNENKADIALVPVGALPDLHDYEIIANYGIASCGPVKSVLLVCNSPIEEIRTIFTDSDSLSSAKLVKVLAKYYWNKEYTIISTNLHLLKSINKDEAIMLIGDKALFLKETYKYIYDLALLWKNFSRLPFVFAVWIRKKELDYHQLDLFSRAIEYGISQIPLALEKYNSEKNNFLFLLDYLTNNIILNYDNKEKEGMNYYLSLLHKLNSIN